MHTKIVGLKNKTPKGLTWTQLRQSGEPGLYSNSNKDGDIFHFLVIDGEPERLVIFLDEYETAEAEHDTWKNHRFLYLGPASLTVTLLEK